MIRIDEIYNHTFWPFIKNNIPRTRMWFCDPPGHIQLDDLKNYAPPGNEFNYIFVFDQEPLNYRRMQPLLNHIYSSQNNVLRCPGAGVIITSEHNSNIVDRICQTYDWHQFYYFYNGWAALDWFRGYNRTFLVSDPASRQIKHTFISPNRIFGGERRHRLVMLYHLFNDGLAHNLISCPAVCPAEGTTIIDAAETLANRYPNAVGVFSKQQFPMKFADETNVPSYQSSQLDLFDETSKCLIYLVTETVGAGQRHHLTEKVFKPICLKMPFMLASSHGSLAYLRSYGFKTFGDVWDESYDDEPDDYLRLEKISKALQQLDVLPQSKKQELFKSCLPIIEHNYKHFYDGGFEDILWDELQEMLNGIQTKLSI